MPPQLLPPPQALEGCLPLLHPWAEDLPAVVGLPHLPLVPDLAATLTLAETLLTWDTLPLPDQAVSLVLDPLALNLGLEVSLGSVVSLGLEGSRDSVASQLLIACLGFLLDLMAVTASRPLDLVLQAVAQPLAPTEVHPVVNKDKFFRVLRTWTCLSNAILPF